MILTPSVVVFTNPINMVAHPTYPDGYRWSVIVGGQQPSSLEFCTAAGHAKTEEEALVIGESHGASACLALRKFGIPAKYSVIRLTFDPIPAEADYAPLATFG